MSGTAVMRRIGTDLPDAVRWAAAVGILVCVATGIGVLTVESATMAVLAGAAVLAIGMAAVNLSLVAVLAFPATLVMIRAGGALSVSDVVLAAATVPCLLLMRWKEAADLKPLLWLAIAYQAMLLPTLALNPYKANAIEWVHEAFLVGGSLIVGWVAGRNGHARRTINIYVALCCCLAVATIIVGIIWFGKYGRFEPVSLPNFHKNFIGNTLAYTFLIAFVRPKWLGWSQRTCVLLMTLFAVGIAASQARQAVISVIIAIVILSFRGRQAGLGKARVLLIMLLPALWVVIRTVQNQLALHDNFNSTSQRLIWYSQSIEIWKTSPLFGVGCAGGTQATTRLSNHQTESSRCCRPRGSSGCSRSSSSSEERRGSSSSSIRNTETSPSRSWSRGSPRASSTLTGSPAGVVPLAGHRPCLRPAGTGPTPRGDGVRRPHPYDLRPTGMAQPAAYGRRWRVVGRD